MATTLSAAIATSEIVLRKSPNKKLMTSDKESSKRLSQHVSLVSPSKSIQSSILFPIRYRIKIQHIEFSWNPVSVDQNHNQLTQRRLRNTIPSNQHKLQNSTKLFHLTATLLKKTTLTDQIEDEIHDDEHREQMILTTDQLVIKSEANNNQQMINANDNSCYKLKFDQGSIKFRCFCRIDQDGEDEEKIVEFDPCGHRILRLTLNYSGHKFERIGFVDLDLMAEFCNMKSQHSKPISMLFNLNYLDKLNKKNLNFSHLKLFYSLKCQLDTTTNLTKTKNFDCLRLKLSKQLPKPVHLATRINLFEDTSTKLRDNQQETLQNKTRISNRRYTDLLLKNLLKLFHHHHNHHQYKQNHQSTYIPHPLILSQSRRLYRVALHFGNIEYLQSSLLDFGLIDSVQAQFEVKHRRSSLTRILWHLHHNMDLNYHQKQFQSIKCFTKYSKLNHLNEKDGQPLANFDEYFQFFLYDFFEPDSDINHTNNHNHHSLMYHLQTILTLNDTKNNLNLKFTCPLIDFWTQPSNNQYFYLEDENSKNFNTKQFKLQTNQQHQYQMNCTKLTPKQSYCTLQFSISIKPVD